MQQTFLVKVYAGAGAESVVDDGKKLHVYVREPAQNGLANRVVCLVLSRHFGVGQK